MTRQTVTTSNSVFDDIDDGHDFEDDGADSPKTTSPKQPNHTL